MVKMTPPDFDGELTRAGLPGLSACTGRLSQQVADSGQKVPKSWSSRSFLSVSTTTVGFSIAGFRG